MSSFPQRSSSHGVVYNCRTDEANVSASTSRSFRVRFGTAGTDVEADVFLVPLNSFSSLTMSHEGKDLGRGAIEYRTSVFFLEPSKR